MPAKSPITAIDTYDQVKEGRRRRRRGEPAIIPRSNRNNHSAPTQSSNFQRLVLVTCPLIFPSSRRKCSNQAVKLVNHQPASPLVLALCLLIGINQTKSISNNPRLISCTPWVVLGAPAAVTRAAEKALTVQMRLSNLPCSWYLTMCFNAPLLSNWRGQMSSSPCDNKEQNAVHCL